MTRQHTHESRFPSAVNTHAGLQRVIKAPSAEVGDVCSFFLAEQLRDVSNEAGVPLAGRPSSPDLTSTSVNWPVATSDIRTVSMLRGTCGLSSYYSGQVEPYQRVLDAMGAASGSGAWHAAACTSQVRNKHLYSCRQLWLGWIMSLPPCRRSAKLLLR